MHLLFDTSEAISKLRAGKGLTGEGGAITPLLKSFMEEALKGEVEDHIRREEEPNRKNGKSRKTVRSSMGKFELETPSDRAGTFDPKLLGKRQKNLANDIERHEESHLSLLFILHQALYKTSEICILLENGSGKLSLATIKSKRVKLLKEYKRNGISKEYKET